MAQRKANSTTCSFSPNTLVVPFSFSPLSSMSSWKLVTNPKINQKPKVLQDRISIPGTKYPAIISARLWTGALDVWASSTNFTIWFRVVSQPTWVAFIRKDPVWLTVLPMTRLFNFLFTCIGSPVTIDSSTADVPWITIPSTGIFAPKNTENLTPVVRQKCTFSKSFNINALTYITECLRVFVRQT